MPTKTTRSTTNIRRGSKHPQAVLTERTVRTMRAAVKKGTKVADLARKYDVTYLTAYRAVNGTTWRHVE